VSPVKYELSFYIPEDNILQLCLEVICHPKKCDCINYMHLHKTGSLPHMLDFIYEEFLLILLSLS
jgi:hypothetical protein